ncbi:hypothetical protein Kosp01_03350 [Kocuria sp. NBRC 114282]|nr:hypothetical protein Kosp01_03350 [Kocuria sp. NBRC 114282]
MPETVSETIARPTTTPAAPAIPWTARSTSIISMLVDRAMPAELSVNTEVPATIRP